MLWGFPLWWVLGATVIAGVVLTLVMLSYLVHHRAVRLVPGSYAITAFVVWVAPCVMMIDSTARLLGFVYRYSILLVGFTAFFYTISAGSRLNRRKITTALTFLWLVTVAGGVMALAFPRMQLSTPIGHLMPTTLGDNQYVHDLFFPRFAEIQHPFGSPTTFVRPAAPFPYANSWGVAIVLLTPAAVAGLLQSSFRVVRGGIIVAICVMMFPALGTSNRAMFAAMVLAAVYVVVRLAWRNRAVPVLTISALAAAATVVLIANGLITQMRTRQAYGDSSGTRLSLYEETFHRSLASPLLGHGTPLPSHVQAMSVGTQGYVWTLMFSFGFVGLFLFMAFLWGTTIRTFRSPGDIDVVLHSILVVASVIIVVYGLDVMQLLTIMLVAAVLLRRRCGFDDSEPGG